MKTTQYVTDHKGRKIKVTTKRVVSLVALLESFSSFSITQYQSI